MVPGMPARNSSPAMPAAALALAMVASIAPAPALISVPWASILANSRPNRITTPATPPSRTNRLEPSPITVIGTSAGRRRETR